MLLEVGVDALAEEVDRAPLCLGIRLGDAGRLAHALDAHLVRELDFAFLGEPAYRGGARRLRRAGERNVSLAREKSRGRVQADPPRAREVGLAPGVQVREVVIRAGWAI